MGLIPGPLFGELRSHMPLAVAKQKNKQTNKQKTIQLTKISISEYIKSSWVTVRMTMEKQSFYRREYTDSKLTYEQITSVTQEMENKALMRHH